MKNDFILIPLIVTMIVLLPLFWLNRDKFSPPAEEPVGFDLCCEAEVCYEATVISQTDWLNRQEGVGVSLLDTRCSHSLDEVKAYAEHHRSHKHHVMITKLARTENGIDFRGIDE